MNLNGMSYTWQIEKVYIEPLTDKEGIFKAPAIIKLHWSDRNV